MCRRLFLLLLCLPGLALAGAPAASPAPSPFQALADAARPGIVTVAGYDKDDVLLRTRPGFFVGDTHVVTVRHPLIGAQRADVTLADGNLKITGLEAGGYVIEFTAVGFFPRTITTQVAPSTDVAQQEVIMVPLGSLQGQVNDDTAAPVQGVTLRLLKGTEVVATTTTSATGEYLFSRKLLPTTYTVEVVSSNYSSTPRSVVGALAATLNLDVVVRGLSLITGEVKQLELLKGEFEPYETSDFNVYIRNGMLGAAWTDASTIGLSKSLGGYRVGVAPTLNSDDTRMPLYHWVLR